MSEELGRWRGSCLIPFQASKVLFPSNVDCWLHSKAHFTLGVKAEIEKTISICPKLLINAELYGLVYKGKKDTLEFGNPICNPWGQCSSIY
jgi:hypothetical protein